MLNPRIAQHLQLGFLRLTRSTTYFVPYNLLSSSVITEVKDSAPKYVLSKQFNFHSENTRNYQLKLISLQSDKLMINKRNAKLFANKINPASSLQVRQFSSGAQELATNQIFVWLSDSTPVHYAQKLLLLVHETSGLPWWATIVLTTVLLRTLVTLPLAIYQNYILAKHENIQTLEMPEIVKQLKKETAVAIKKYGWTEKQAQFIFRKSVKKQWLKLVMRDNCHPFKAGVLVWVQLPMWISTSVALRNLALMLPDHDAAAQLTLLELSVGGIGWIHNLAMPDQMLILPIFLGILNLLIIELQSMTKIRKESKLQKLTLNTFRFISVLMIPIAAAVPTCMSLYWVTSSTFGIAQNMAMLSPQVRRAAGIPKTASELEQPYSHIALQARTRINRLMSWQPQSKES